VAHSGVPPTGSVDAVGFADLAVAATWSPRVAVAVPLLLLSGAYAIGWWRLSRRGTPIAPWRVVAVAGSLTAIALALSSPLDRVVDQIFAGHMVQHLLLIAVAAPALLLGNPFPALLWGLPGPLRVHVGLCFRPGAPLRRLGVVLTALPVAWTLHVLVLWLWHLPRVYDAAVADRLVHDLEHLAFFGTAVLFWWPVIRPAPRLGPPAPYVLRVTYLVLGAFQSAMLGILLSVSPESWYASYARTATSWGLTPGEDQALGGVIMWGAGGAIDMLAVLVLTHCYLASEDHPADLDRPAASRHGVSRTTRRRPAP
jgi:putative membrane protein